MNKQFDSLIRSLIAPATILAILAVAAAYSRAENSSAGDAALFDRLDSNGDGKIAAGEVAPEHERLFARLLRRADANEHKELSREEFLAALVPTRPAKALESKQADSYPQADAVRYLLLTMDTNRNSSIHMGEVPLDMLLVFDALAERVDANKNDTLDRFELGRSAPILSQAAMRYVAREKIDVAKELKELKRTQGKAAARFDEQPPALDSLGDPKKAGTLFAQWDANGDGQIALDEVPEPIQAQLQRFMRLTDTNRDNRLNEREFLVGAERLARMRRRQMAQEMPAREKEAEPKAMPADSMPADDK